jgi:hypothetical protein
VKLPQLVHILFQYIHNVFRSKHVEGSTITMFVFTHTHTHTHVYKSVCSRMQHLFFKCIFMCTHHSTKTNTHFSTLRCNTNSNVWQKFGTSVEIKPVISAYFVIAQDSDTCRFHATNLPIFLYRYGKRYSYNKTNEMHWVLKFLFGTELYMFRTGSLSIIRSPALYTQQ